MKGAEFDKKRKWGHTLGGRREGARRIQKERASRESRPTLTRREQKEKKRPAVSQQPGKGKGGGRRISRKKGKGHILSPIIGIR